MSDLTTYKSKEILSEDIEKDSLEGCVTIKIQGDGQNISYIFPSKNWQKLGEQIISYSNFLKRKDEYFVLAIKNLIIQNNFLELALQLEEGQISEEEYRAEIDNNPNRYIVKMGKIENHPEDIGVIHEVVKRIGIDFTVDEVASLFSIDQHNLESSILKLK
ncbi:hypothetical protein ACFLSA_00835 [Bacteroidota bacterium]